MVSPPYAAPPDRQIQKPVSPKPYPLPSSSPIPNNQTQIHTLLRKSLHGELIDTQFFLFSTRSKRGDDAAWPQALFANDEVLAESSEYFSNLFSGKSLNDPTLVELQDYQTCEDSISINDYGYASDSDLDDDDDEASTLVQDELEPSNLTTKGSGRIIPSRRIMIIDTAFKTWEALLYYLYTGEITFALLRSQRIGMETSESLHTPLRCSPKSMYRLACKIQHGELQRKSLAAIQSSLSERNIVQELSSSLASSFPPILEMEIEKLFQHVATPTVIKDFPTLVKRIVDTPDLPHGADVLIQLHEKILRQHYPILTPVPAPPSHTRYLVTPMDAPNDMNDMPAMKPSSSFGGSKEGSIFVFGKPSKHGKI